MTILLIEDDHRFGDLIQMSLPEVDIYVTDTLKAAKNWLEIFRADLILVDLGLPDSHGLKTLEELKFSKIPKVVLTGSDHLEEGAIKLGCVDYIKKGNPKEICERIRFNMGKFAKKPRFRADVFQQIRSCIEMSVNRELVAAN